MPKQYEYLHVNIGEYEFATKLAEMGEIGYELCSAVDRRHEEREYVGTMEWVKVKEIRECIFKRELELSKSISAGSGTANDVSSARGVDWYINMHSAPDSGGLNSEIDYDKPWNSKSNTPSKPLNSEWEIVKVRNKFYMTDKTFGIEYFEGRKLINGQNYDYVVSCIMGGNKYTIESVKRLSDGEVFSVGDEVQYRSAESFQWEATKVWDGKIKSIKPAYNKEQLEFEIDDNGEWNDSVFPHKYIQNIRHKPTPSQPQNNKERITISVFFSGVAGGDMQARLNRAEWKFPLEKRNAIKQAIEQVLNS